MTEQRGYSTITDRLTAVLDFLRETEYKRASVTWERIAATDVDEKSGVVVPILEIEK